MTHVQDKGCLDAKCEEGEQVGGGKQDGRDLVVTEQCLPSANNSSVPEYSSTLVKNATE